MRDNQLTKILEVNLFAFAYRLFHRDFSPLNGAFCIGTHSFFQLFILIYINLVGLSTLEFMFDS